MKLNEARNTGAIKPDADGFYTVIVGSFPDTETAEKFADIMKKPKVIYDLKRESMVGFSAVREAGLVSPLFAVRGLYVEGNFVRASIKPVGVHHEGFRQLLESDAPKSFCMELDKGLTILGYDWVSE